jgi:DNA-binding beta-propeller fold protein YncE
MFVGAGGTRLLAINKAWGMVSVFDTGSMSLVANIHVGFTGDTHAAISHDGKTLAVLSSGVGIRLIDTATLRVVDTLPVTDPTSAVAFSADGRRLYLGNGAVVDIKARAVVARLAYGATNVETSRDGRYLLAENALNMTLRVIMLR